MNQNFFSLVNTTYAAMPHFLERGKGSFVNIASIGGKIAVPHLAPYTASKFAVVGFSETLNAELRSKGIQVTTVSPGLMRTGSHPNARFVGKQQQEYKWFSQSATLPGLAHSAHRAAQKIYSAVRKGKSEIEIGAEAFAAARLHGLLPELTIFLGSIAETVILPEAVGSEAPKQGKQLATPGGKLWRRWSDSHTRRLNQPSA
jgi:short-subunit dehydrogenase